MNTRGGLQILRNGRQAGEWQMQTRQPVKRFTWRIIMQSFHDLTKGDKGPFHQVLLPWPDAGCAGTSQQPPWKVAPCTRAPRFQAAAHEVPRFDLLSSLNRKRAR